MSWKFVCAIWSCFRMGLEGDVIFISDRLGRPLGPLVLLFFLSAETVDFLCQKPFDVLRVLVASTCIDAGQRLKGDGEVFDPKGCIHHTGSL